MANTSPPGESLTAILSLDKTGEHAFSANLEGAWGETLACDLLARVGLAVSSVCDKTLHSLHACHLVPAVADTPVTLAVEPLQEGSTFARYRIVVRQAGTICCDAIASMVAEEDGRGYQSASLDPQLPSPEDLPTERETAGKEGWLPYATGPIETRRISERREPAVPGQTTLWSGWLMPREPLPRDDPAMHMAALIYASGYRSHWAVEKRLGNEFDPGKFTSLDHALWVHRALAWHDWWLARTTTEVAHAGRALSRREIFNREGILIASMAEEAQFVAK